MVGGIAFLIGGLKNIINESEALSGNLSQLSANALYSMSTIGNQISTLL